MMFTMHFYARDVMLGNYSLVNEKMVDKMNVKIVSAMLNEVRSIKQTL